VLNKLQPKEVENIRQHFYSHPLYTSIKEACSDCCALTVTSCLRQEHIFAEVISFIDELKQHQQDIQWKHIYQDIYQDYRYQNSQILDEELHTISSTIVCTLASILAMSIPSFYHSLSSNLLQQVFKHNQRVPSEHLYALMDTMEGYDKEISHWLDEYMQSDDFISDTIQEYFMPVDMLVKKMPEHIIFTNTATISMRDEFKNVLIKAIRDKKNWGKAGRIKYLLNKYRDDEIILLLGNEIDIYRDLCECYDYKQDRSTFLAAGPKLTRNKT